MAVGQVEGRDRLVAEQEPRTRRQRPGQADALPLAAGERLRHATSSCSTPQSAATSASRSRAGPRGQPFKPNRMLAATVRCGNSRSSWKIMPIRRLRSGSIDSARRVEQRRVRPGEHDPRRVASAPRSAGARSSCRRPTARRGRRSRSRASARHRARATRGLCGPHELPGSPSRGSLTA